MKTTRTFLFCLISMMIIVLSVQANSIKIGKRFSYYFSALDTVQGLLYISTEDSLKVVNLNYFIIVKSIKLEVSGMKPKDMIPIVIDKELYFVNNEGGQVYRYEDGTCQRIDQSFTHKMQLSSNLFVNDNKIFRYGGYGFWSYRNYFTCFDFTTKEWDVISPVNSKVFPQGSGFGTIVKIIDNNWFVFGGLVIDQKNPVSSDQNNECWVFHSDTKEWQRMGLLTENIRKPHMAYIHYKNEVLVVMSGVSYLLDLQKNRMKTYSNSILANSIRICDSEFFHSFYYKNNYWIFGSPSESSNIHLFKITESEFLSNYIGQKQIYKTYTKELFIFSISIVLMAGIAIFIWIRRKRLLKDKVKLMEGKLIYKSVEIKLDVQQYELLQLFLNNVELTTNDLFDFIQTDQLHYSQKLRTIANMIDDLNFKVGLMLEKDVQVIQKIKSSEDKRIKVYRLQKQYFS